MGVEIKFGTDLDGLSYQDILDWLAEHKADNVGDTVVYKFWTFVSAYKDASQERTPRMLVMKQKIRDAILAGKLPKFDAR